MKQHTFRILLVEDKVYFQDHFTKSIASSLTAKIDVATDLQSAKRHIFGALPPDLIVISMDLPNLDGQEILRKIRSEQTLDNTPIICVTDLSDTDAKMEILEIGADDFVSRSASTGVFLARIKTQLRHKMALDRLNRMAIDRDMFAAGVLHDIRNIETTISIVCEYTTLKLQQDPEAYKREIDENLDILIKSASKLGKYATDVIKSVRATEREIQLKPVSPRALLDWASDILTTKSSDSQIERVSLEADGALDLVLADEDFLKIAIFNIVQNSLKYRLPTETQRLIVSQEVRAPEAAEGRRRLVTRIRDFGQGVKKSELKKIFEPFKRGSDQVKGTGFGLGLSMVSKVISRMGGRVWAELPSDGPGLIVCLELPAAQ